MPSERLGAFLCFLGEKYLPKGNQLMLLERSRQGRSTADFCCRSDVLSVKKQAVCRPGAWRFGPSKSLTRRWMRQPERERPALDGQTEDRPISLSKAESLVSTEVVSAEKHLHPPHRLFGIFLRGEGRQAEISFSAFPESLPRCPDDAALI